MNEPELAGLLAIGSASGDVDIADVKRIIASTLVLNRADLRFVVWQLALGVIPPQRAMWERVWGYRVKQYFGLVRKLFRRRDNFLETGNGVIECTGTLRMIHSDVMRLTRVLPALERIVGPDDRMEHVRRLERVIYAFSFVSPRCPYTQGFHELAGPLYCVAVEGARISGMSDDHAEAVCFVMLFNLVTVGKFDVLFGQLDKQDELEQKLRRLEDAIRGRDHEFADFMFVSLRIRPIQFSFSWISLIFAQHIEYNDLVQLWDRMFFYGDNIIEFAITVSAAYILSRRESMRQLDFNGIMTELHAMDGLDLVSVLSMAEEIWQSPVNTLSV